VLKSNVREVFNAGSGRQKTREKCRSKQVGGVMVEVKKERSFEGTNGKVASSNPRLLF
jgi:hypothetical protein